MARANPINAFNRILLLVLGALALIGGVIALLLVTQVIHPADVSPAGFFQGFWQRIANLSGGAATTAVIGSILLALADAAADGRLRPGQLVLMTGMGAGLTWGSALMRWTI